MGGNIFKEYARPIVRENIKPTISKYIEYLGNIFPNKSQVFENFQTVGSAGAKDISGDIDLAIDLSCFFEGDLFNKEELGDYKIDFLEWDKLYKKFDSRARTATTHMCKLRAFMTLMAKAINADNTIYVAEKRTLAGNMFTMFSQYDAYGRRDHRVQIDWMVGNLPWLKFAYHSEETGQLKGLHRTQLLVAMLSSKGYTFSHVNGIKEKGSDEFIVTTPKGAVDLISELYGNISLDETDNYNNLYCFLKFNATPEEYKKAINIYINILTVSRARIPMNIRGLIDDNA